MEVSYNLKKRKKIIRKAGIIFLIVIVLLTFFSKTINNILLPEVEYTSAYSGALEKGVEATGEISTLEMEQVFSYGNWKIEEVKVKENDEITKGAVLAVINKNEVLLDLKNKEIEVVRQENDLSSYMNDFINIDISAYEQAAEKAKKELEKQKENQDNIKALYNAGAETSKSLKDAGYSVEAAEEDYAEKLKLVEDKKAEQVKKSEEYDRKVKEKRLEIEIKKLEFENLKIKLPENGEIKAETDGVLRSVLVQKGVSLSSGQLMFEIAKSDSKTAVIWKLDEKKSESLALGDDVAASVKIPEDKTFDTRISTKKYLPKEAAYEFSAIIDMEDIKLQDGQKVKIKVIKRGGDFDSLVPSSSIVNMGGKDYIFLIYESTGVFGQEYHVREREIKVLESDDFNTAIIGLDEKTKDMIVTYSTKMLSNRMQVKLR